MMHGPCGPLNAKNNSMSKNVLVETTSLKIAGPHNGNKGTTVKVQCSAFDNKLVLPYNLYMLPKFDYYLTMKFSPQRRLFKYLYSIFRKGVR